MEPKRLTDSRTGGRGIRLPVLFVFEGGISGAEQGVLND
jgi:hypothetical protein